MTGLESFTNTYGLAIGFILYILLKDVIPFIVVKFLPAQLKAAEDERQAKIKQEEEDREWRSTNEREHLAAINRIAESTQMLTLNMTQTNERIGTMMVNQQAIMSKQDTTQNFLMKAVADMRETVAAETGKRTKKMKTGPLGDSGA
jgi:hypothetical protein